MNSTLLPAGIDLHALHRYAPERYPFLLESTASQRSLGGFDLLLLSDGDALLLDARRQLSGPGAAGESRFLAALDTWWQGERVPETRSPWPFTGGWFLYLGYELAEEIEPGLRLRPDPLLPAALAVRCSAAVVHEHSTGDFHFIAEPTSKFDVQEVLWDVHEAGRVAHGRPAKPRLRIDEEDPALFLAAVAAAKQHIAQGDIYQANLSRGWTATVGTPFDPNRVYEALCASNPGSFAGMFRWGSTTVVSSSPERLLRVTNDMISTRPIAGTRPRSEDPEQDRRLLQELIADPKERAEHVMLIDLERNDLGRVCEAGTVRVDEMMIIESYAHVHHIVSNICGRKRADVTPGQVIRAVFPGGTITGCPKVRCMQIINELENSLRGAYTGSFGYLNRDGTLDLNILIRTIVISAQEISFRAGSGIVADSEPVAELEETRAKARGLIKALST